MSRAARRAERARTGAIRDIPTLLTAVGRARVSGVEQPLSDRARQVVAAYVQAAAAQGRAVDAILADLNAGRPAVAAARAALDQSPEPGGLACAKGCAFCCILPGEDGGTITGAEARALHAALRPLAQEPDGRSWHPRACPALDPDTRICRAYEARPVICRTYVSYDAGACESIAEGEPAAGAGVLGPQRLYLAVHSLCRAILAGHAAASTYSLRRTAEGAVAGSPLDETLAAARHKPRNLPDELRRSGGTGLPS